MNSNLEKGFTIYSFAPNSNDLTMVVSSLNKDRIATGTLEQLRICFNTSKPCLSGRVKSSKIIQGRWYLLSRSVRTQHHGLPSQARITYVVYSPAIKKGIKNV